jgi:Leucine-rich repeat (LRR) protein
LALQGETASHDEEQGLFFTKLQSLDEIDLSNSKEAQEKLFELPNALSSLTGLSKLNLSGAAQLRTLAPAIVELVKLKELRLDGCTSMEQPPDTFFSPQKLSNLEVLVMANCSNLRFLPASISWLSALKELEFHSFSGLQQLPSLDEGQSRQLGHLSALTQLTKINLSQNSLLLALPESIGHVCNLRSLDLSGCSSLENLPSSISQLTQLTSLNLEGCKKLTSFPDLSMCNDLDHVGLKKTGITSVPFSRLPLKIARRNNQQFQIIQAQKDELRQSATAVSWIAILLATTSFVGFITVPGGSLENAGVVRVNAPYSQTQQNQAALKSYFICNVFTFCYSLATALFCVTHNLPSVSPPSVPDFMRQVRQLCSLLTLSILFGTATFLSSVYAVYPLAVGKEMIVCIAVAPSITVLPRLCGLFYRVWKVIRFLSESGHLHGVPIAFQE